jgi:hypothetical protein
MSKRVRYTWRVVIAVVGIWLAIGAWHPSPGQDSDSQGAYLLVFLFFVVLLCIYVSTAMRDRLALPQIQAEWA